MSGMSKCDTCYWDVNGCFGHSCTECEHKDSYGQCYCTLTDSEGPDCPYYEYDERMEGEDYDETTGNK